MPNKFVLSVLGQDRPGIVALVTRILAENGCNIEDLTQTILQSQFAAIIIFTAPDGSTPASLEKDLDAALDPLGLNMNIKSIQTRSLAEKPFQPFVVTTQGKDRVGQIALLSEAIRHFDCNITKINAINRSELYPDKIVMIFEIDVPLHTDINELKKAVGQAAENMQLSFSVQHRDIFENIHRI
ncbi:MAG: glycine cleavage system protein R [Desulfonatronovibrionaceae bacterium]